MAAAVTENMEYRNTGEEEEEEEEDVKEVGGGGEEGDLENGNGKRDRNRDQVVNSALRGDSEGDRRSVCCGKDRTWFV